MILCWLQGAQKFSDLLTEAADALSTGAPLKIPPEAVLVGVDLRQGSFNKAANLAEKAAACNECVAAWCALLEGILNEAIAVRRVSSARLVYPTSCAHPAFAVWLRSSWLCFQQILKCRKEHKLDFLCTLLLLLCC